MRYTITVDVPDDFTGDLSDDIAEAIIHVAWKFWTTARVVTLSGWNGRSTKLFDGTSPTIIKVEM